jgi:hypothetical protein
MRRFSRSDVEKFVLDEYLPTFGRVPRIDELVNAVQGRYPDVPRDFVRKLKALHAPGKRGRRKA